jgi:5-methylcytosine-specific restriction endonuclease McrA
MTEAGFRGFVRSLLRAGSLKWRPRNEALNKAYVRDGINPATGRKCKLHKCSICSSLSPKNAMRVDHIEPIVDPSVGFVSWDLFIDRLFCEVSNLQALCEECHTRKTKVESMIASGKMVAVRKRTR